MKDRIIKYFKKKYKLYSIEDVISIIDSAPSGKDRDDFLWKLKIFLKDNYEPKS